MLMAFQMAAFSLDIYPGCSSMNHAGSYILAALEYVVLAIDELLILWCTVKSMHPSILHH